MNTYIESKKALDKIREDFCCKGDIIFRTAIQYVVEYGRRTFKDYDFVMNQMAEIDGKHDDAEANGKTLFISRDFEKAIIECAEALSKINTYDLLIYIQKELWLGGDGIDYQRAIKIMKGCIAWVLADTYETDYALQEIREMGFNDNEIEELGFGWMLDAEEEEEL